MVKKMNFGIEGEFYAEGITFGQRWNGFHCPYFTYENALKVLAMQDKKEVVLKMECEYYEMSENKLFIIGTFPEGKEELKGKFFEGEMYYPIGFCNWVWMEIPEDENED